MGQVWRIALKVTPFNLELCKKIGPLQSGSGASVTSCSAAKITVTGDIKLKEDSELVSSKSLGFSHPH